MFAAAASDPEVHEYLAAEWPVSIFCHECAKRSQDPVELSRECVVFSHECAKRSQVLGELSRGCVIFSQGARKDRRTRLNFRGSASSFRTSGRKDRRTREPFAGEESFFAINRRIDASRLTILRRLATNAEPRYPRTLPNSSRHLSNTTSLIVGWSVAFVLPIWVVPAESCYRIRP